MSPSRDACPWQGSKDLDAFLLLVRRAMNAPFFCRPEAYQLFASSLSSLASTKGLIQAALSISLHALEDLDMARIERRLDALAERVAKRARRSSPEARIAHLHQVLFEEEGFVGEFDGYDRPVNSYLPVVLETGRGIPISLALVYKAVGERVGLEIDGINAPGHFLLRVRDSRGWLLIDPYRRGKALTEAEVYELVDRIFRRPVPRTYSLCEPATHAQWIERMLRNLKSSFADYGCTEDHGAMDELQSLLGGVTA